MEDTKCNNCEIPVKQVAGKRTRLFCSDVCRQISYQKRKKSESEPLEEMITISKREYDELKNLIISKVPGIAKESDLVLKERSNFAIFMPAKAIDLKSIGRELKPEYKYKEDNEPVKQPGENSIDFAARKNDWKLKNNK